MPYYENHDYHSSERPFIIEQIRSVARGVKPPPVPKIKLQTRRVPAPPTVNLPLAQGDKLLDIKPVNQWMADERLNPVPKKLFGSFWLEGELCILFADTNMGKSILAVQLGNSISKQEPIGVFEAEAAPATVLYIDIELSARQFELRYTDTNGSYQFADNFYRAEYNTQKDIPTNFNTYQEYMHYTLEWAIRNVEPQVLIIDNITCLSEGTGTVGQALALMKHLKALKVKHNLSILVLAHTPKRNPGKPITRDDMGGSKMLMNFADSAFTIAESFADVQGGDAPPTRYLKQVKQRSGGETYGQCNVCLCRLQRQGRFLQYEFTGYGHELDHLLHPGRQTRQRLQQQVQALHQRGYSQRQMAAELNISLGVVNKYLKVGES
jgi:archaellum biogenesis ATPase FlaH